MLKFFSEKPAYLLAITFSLSLLAIALIPNIERLLLPKSQSPGSLTTLGLGITLTILTSVALYYGIRTKYKFSNKLILFAIIYNCLIVWVKFVLGPFAFYEVNKRIDLVFEINSSPIFSFIIALGVLLMYLLVYSIIYRYFKRKLEKRLNLPRIVLRGKLLITTLVVLIITVFAVSSFLFPFYSTIPVIIYLYFIFSSIVSLVIAFSLVCAILFGVLAFDNATEQAAMLRDSSIFVSFFWVGISFLLVYHALWVVYLLVLISLWPLRVVIPK